MGETPPKKDFTKEMKPKEFEAFIGNFGDTLINSYGQALQEGREQLAAASQEPKPEPAAEPAVVPDASVGSSPDVIADPVNPDVVAPVSGVDDEHDKQVPKPTRRRQGRRNAQQPTPVTPPTQPTPAATALSADPATSTIDISADVKSADDAVTAAGVPDGLLDPEDALKIQNAVDAQNAQQAATTVDNKNPDANLNVANPVATLQPRKRPVNQLDPADAAAVVAAGTAVPVAAGGIPTGIDPNSLPVLNNPLLGTPETIVAPETATSPEAVNVETSEAGEMSETEKLKSEVERLKLIVDERRMAYVSVDYKQKSKWKKLRNFFGIKSEELADGDTNVVLSDYRQALTAYQEAQLAAIKGEGLDGVKLREQLGGMLRYLKYDEQLELKKYRDQVKVETGGFGNNVIAGFEKVGRLYNGIPKKYKFIVAAGLVGLTGGSVLAGSAGLATAAGAATLFKRVVATAGLAVTIDSGWEGWQGKKLKEMADIQKDEDLDFIFSESGVREGEEDARFRKLREFLDKDLDQVEQKFQAQKKRDKWRRGISWTAANALVLGASAASAAMGGGGMTEEARARAELATHGSGGAASVPDAGASAARAVDRAVSAAAASSSPAESASAAARAASSVAGAAPGVPGSSVAGEVINELPNATNQHLFENETEGNRLPNALNQNLFQEPSAVSGGVAAEAVSVSESAASLLKEHAVTAADGKRGLWGILDNRLSESIPKGPGRDRMIQSLENIMRAKLDAMSPAERAAAGFPKALENGKVNLDFIKVGDTISFSKLLTPQEIQSVLDGQSVGTPSGADHLLTQNPDGGLLNKAEIAEARKMYDQSMLDHAMDKAEYQDKMAGLDATKGSTYEETMKRLVDTPEKPIVAAAEAANDSSYQEILATSDPKQFLLDNPSRKNELFGAVAKLRMEIFMMNPGEGGTPLEYDYSVKQVGDKLGKTSITQVLNDLKGFERFQISYDRVKNPLHYDQMKALGKFVAATEKAFGPELSMRAAGEDIQHYTSRMATVALRTGKEIKGFYVPDKSLKLAS